VWAERIREVAQENDHSRVGRCHRDSRKFRKVQVIEIIADGAMDQKEIVFDQGGVKPNGDGLARKEELVLDRVE